MLIYIDLFLILNYWIDFLLLITTNIILKYSIKYKRILLAALIGCLSTFLIFVKNSTILIISKIIICIIMQLISNGFKGIKTLLENCLYFYLVCIILSGALYLFKINLANIKFSYLLLSIFTPFILFIYERKIKKIEVYYKDIYNVEIIYNGKLYTFNGYLDTGNKLYDQYKKRPISIVYSNKIKFNYENGILVPYETTNGKSLLKCIKVEKMIIDKRIINNVLIGLSDKPFQIQDINMILHKDIIGGLK